MQGVNFKIGFVAVLLLLFASILSGQSIQRSASDSTLLKPRLQINLDYKNKLDGFIPFRRGIKYKSYADQLPFFCKMEHKMSVNARFPVRIRLGSVDYVNQLEGKGH